MNTPIPDPPMVSNVTKATYGVGGSGVLLTYLASVLSVKYNIPLEVSAVGVGGILAFVGRWAGKLYPHE